MSSREKHSEERVSGATAKERIMALVQAQPADNSYDEILRELGFARMVDRGLADADGGHEIETAELRQRVRRWWR